MANLSAFDSEIEKTRQTVEAMRTKLEQSGVVLDKLAKATERSRAALAAEAVRQFVELNEWQIHEIQSALREADAGDFAKPAEVNKVLGKWRKPA